MCACGKEGGRCRRIGAVADAQVSCCTLRAVIGPVLLPSPAPHTLPVCIRLRATHLHRCQVQGRAACVGRHQAHRVAAAGRSNGRASIDEQLHHLDLTPRVGVAGEGRGQPVTPTFFVVIRTASEPRSAVAATHLQPPQQRWHHQQQRVNTGSAIAYTHLPPPRRPVQRCEPRSGRGLSQPRAAQPAAAVAAATVTAISRLGCVLQ